MRRWVWDSDFDVHHGVCVSITFRWVSSTLFLAEFQEDIQITIPAISEHLKQSSILIGMFVWQPPSSFQCWQLGSIVTYIHPSFK